MKTILTALFLCVFLPTVYAIDSLAEIRSKYSQVDTDEHQRQQYIHSLVELRDKIVAAKQEGWQQIDAELIKHPTPTDVDSNVLRKLEFGHWRSPRHDYLYRADGTWSMLPSPPCTTHGTWSISGNQLHSGWAINPPQDIIYTIILIDQDYFITTNGTQVLIEKRIPDEV